MATSQALSILMMLMFYLASQVVATTQFSVDSAALTTLPSAVPTSNNPNPCAFSNRTSLLNRIDSDWQGYNISLLVTTCRSVCAIAYGSGNPDISGIGAMTSYYIQGIVTLILGPILSLLIIVNDRRNYADSSNTDSSEADSSETGPSEADFPKTDSPKTDSPNTDPPNTESSKTGPSEADSPKNDSTKTNSSKADRSISDSSKAGHSKLEYSLPAWLSAVIPLARYHHQANHIIGLSVLLASSIRLSQEVPLAEISFIESLTMYQILITLFCSTTERVLFDGHGSFTSSFYRVIIFVLGMGIIPRMSSRISKSLVLQQISKFCTLEWDYPLILSSVESDVLESASNGYVTEIMISLFVALAIIILIFLFVRSFSQLKGFKIISSTVTIVGASGFGIWFLVKLQSIRQQLRTAAGEAYQDSEWGFGQIMSVLVWIPLIEGSLRALLQMLSELQ